MKVRYDEGIVNHIGPEPCIGGRKASGEASAGECAGQPSSRGRIVPRAVYTENSDSGVLAVQSAQDRMRYDASHAMNRA